MAAFSDSRLVWEAMPWITVTALAMFWVVPRIRSMSPAA
jgi:hypothetical protein